MSPTAPLDEYHRISLALIARIREWHAAQVAVVEAWSPQQYTKEEYERAGMGQRLPR